MRIRLTLIYSAAGPAPAALKSGIRKVLKTAQEVIRHENVTQSAENNGNSSVDDNKRRRK
jgi:hypothetical protein